jgi:hypothetical protein
MGSKKLLELFKAEHVQYDLKYILLAEACDLRL